MPGHGGSVGLRSIAQGGNSGQLTKNREVYVDEIIKNLKKEFKT